MIQYRFASHLVAALSLSLPVIVTAQTFSSHGFSIYQAGITPEDLVVGDFDGDGVPDAAVANTKAAESGSPDLVSIYLSQGNGIFAPRTDVTVGDRPEGIATGLLDGNSSLDMVTANFNAGTLSVLLGNGSGGFTAGSTIPVAGGPRSITTGDFDGDGKTDLATANYSAATVSFLRGNGSGGFTLIGSTTVGRSPEAIAKGRINGDSALDLVTCNATDDTLTALLGNGNGTFSVLSTISVGDNPRHAKLVDLNGDGFDDLLCANHDSATVSVLRNNSGASFTSQGTLSISGLSGAVYLNAADLNADGRLDVIVSFARSDALGIFPGTGPFTFGAGETVPTGDNPLGIGVGDFDSSGRVDLVVSNALDDNIHVYLSSLNSSSIALDNGQPGTSFTGSWSTSGSPSPYGGTSLFAKATIGAVFTWNVPIPSTSAYSVYAWWTQASSRTKSSPYTVFHEDGQTTILVDQTTGGGRWNFLGTFAFDTMTARVQVSSTSATLSTCADAVCLLPLLQSNAPPMAFIDSVAPSPVSFGSTVTFSGIGLDSNGIVSGYQWRSSLDGVISSASTFSTSALAVGSHDIVFRVQDNQGLWSPEARTTLEVTSVAPVHTVVLDNGDPGTSFTGTWSTSGASNPYGASSIFSKNGATYTYTIPLSATGTYEVYAWWTQLASRPASAPIDITHSAGTSTVSVNQQTNGGQWNLLGTYSFGSTAVIKINAIGSASTCADAVCLSLVGGANVPPTAQITSISPSPSTLGSSVAFNGSANDPDGSIVGYEWRSSLDGQLSTQASFSSSSLSLGTHTISFRAQDNGGIWSSEAQQSLVVSVSGSSTPLIIDNGQPGTSFTGSWTASGGPNPYGAGSIYSKNGATYTYTFSLPSAGAYQVSGWWTQIASRPTSAPIDITHASGTSTVNVNQQANGGQWNSLGTFTFNSTAVVKINALGTASTCADAIRLEPAGVGDIIIDNGGPGTSFIGTWNPSGAPNPYGAGSIYAKNGPTYTYTIPAAGNYKVHAWWTQLATRPTAAPITIQHSGGSSTVNVNQRVNGGQWNLLGTFTFTGQATITIAAVGTDSTCADAVRLEPVP